MVENNAMAQNLILLRYTTECAVATGFPLHLF